MSTALHTSPRDKFRKREATNSYNFSQPQRHFDERAWDNTPAILALETRNLLFSATYKGQCTFQKVATVVTA